MTGATLDLYADYLRASGASDRTVAERVGGARRMLALAGRTDPADLTTIDSIRFVASVNARASRATYHQHVRTFARFLAAVGQPATFADDLPTARFPRGVPRPIDVNELAAAIAQAGGVERTMLLLAAYAGLRVSEIGNIAGEHVDLDAGVLYVHGKGGRDEMIPLHQLLLDQARRYPRTGHWFGAGRGLSRVSVWRHMRDALDRVGSPATPHQVRHFYGTSLLDGGANIRVVQELMRHANLSSTQRYTLVREADRRRAIAMLPELREPPETITTRSLALPA